MAPLNVLIAIRYVTTSDLLLKGNTPPCSFHRLPLLLSIRQALTSNALARAYVVRKDVYFHIYQKTSTLRRDQFI